MGSWQTSKRRSASLAIAIGIALLTAIGSSRADACIIAVEFNEETIDYAETIFRGRPIAYEAFPDEFAVARLTFEVGETYRGTSAETWVVVWQNSTFGLPDDLAAFISWLGDDLVVGIAPPGSIGPMHAPSATVIGPKDPDLWEIPWVIQSPCAPPFMDRYSHLEAALRNRGVIE